MFAGEWARRGDYYFKIWLDAGSPAHYAYTEDQLDGYIETLAWSDWVAVQPWVGAVRDEITAVRAARPW